jgi:hypothetical protein
MGNGVHALVAVAVLVAGALLGQRKLLAVVDHGFASLRTPDVDALLYVAPPYAALALFAVLALLPTERHRRALESVASLVVVAAAVVHTVGLAHLVDRTPRDFPWVLMTIVGAWSLITVVALVGLARKATGAKRSGLVTAAYVALLVPLSVSYVPSHKHDVALALHWLGSAGLLALAIDSICRVEASPRAALEGARVIWAPIVAAALVFFAIAEVPLWPTLSGVMSFRVEGGCSLDCELSFATWWDAVFAFDSDCWDKTMLVIVVTETLVALVALTVLAVWLSRATSAARAAGPGLRPPPCGRSR